MYLKTNMFVVLPPKDTFDSIPISMATHLKLEFESRQCRLEVVGVIKQNCRLSDRHNLTPNFLRYCLVFESDRSVKATEYRL